MKKHRHANTVLPRVALAMCRSVPGMPLWLHVATHATLCVHTLRMLTVRIPVTFIPAGHQAASGPAACGFGSASSASQPPVHQSPVLPQQHLQNRMGKRSGFPASQVGHFTQHQKQRHVRICVTTGMPPTQKHLPVACGSVKRPTTTPQGSTMSESP